MGWPVASATVAVSRTVSPTEVRVKAFRSRVTEAGRCSTVAVAVPVAEPAVAVMVAVPGATAVTRPDALTVTTPMSPLAQVTPVPVMTLPCWSKISAASCAVSPRALSETVAGMMASVVGTGVSGSVGRSSPQDEIASTTAARAAKIANGVPRPDDHFDGMQTIRSSISMLLRW